MTLTQVALLPGLVVFPFMGGDSSTPRLPPSMLVQAPSKASALPAALLDGILSLLSSRPGGGSSSKPSTTWRSEEASIPAPAPLPPQPSPTDGIAGGADVDRPAPTTRVGGASTFSKLTDWRSQLLDIVKNGPMIPSPTPRPTPSQNMAGGLLPQGHPPAYQPTVAGTIYRRQEFSGPWTSSSMTREATILPSAPDKKPASAWGVDWSYEPAEKMSVDDLQKAFSRLGDEASDDSELDQFLQDLDGVPEKHEVVVGEEEEEEDELEKPDPFMVDPIEALGDVMHDSIFKGSSWEAVRRERPKMTLYQTKYCLDKYGSKCEVDVLGEVPHTIIGKMGKRLVDPAGINAILAKKVHCCSGRCLQRWVDELGSNCRMFLETQRYAVAAMLESVRQEYFVRTIRGLLIPKTAIGAHGEGDLIIGYKPVKYRVHSEIPLCQTAYSSICGIGVRTLQRYCKWARNGEGPAMKGRAPGYKTRKTTAARVWLLKYAALHDMMPNSSTRGHTTVVVDVPRKSDVWFTYGLFMLRAGMAKSEILSYKGFLHVWSEDFPWLKTREAKTIEFGCTTCEDLQILLKKYIHKDHGVVATLRLFQHDHNLFQQAERDMYYMRQGLAMRHPDEFASMIADAMQQATTRIPRKGSNHKYEGERMEQKLMAVLAHGRDWQDFFVFRYLPHISCTANAVITCIWRAICYLIKMGRFPKNKKLFLQLDGAGDNVNQTMLRFASWLCQEQICKTVVISRLPVGHTHEDIDQKFSVISRRLKGSDALTPQEFEEQVEGAFSDIKRDSNATVRCQVEDVWGIWDFTGWFQSMGEGPNGAWPNVLGHWAKKDQAALTIRVSRSLSQPSVTEKVYMQTKRFSAPKIREVVTRDESGRTVVFPYYRDVTTCWEPYDSVHGGKLFLQQQIGGRPSYVECCPLGEAPPDWVSKLKKVWLGLRENFKAASLFGEDLREQWESFMHSMPWEGNRSIDPQFLPDFTIPLFPPRRSDTEGVQHHSQALAVLQSAGLDTKGNLRAYFKEGKDQLTYPRDVSMVTYGNFLLNGVKFDPATMGKRKRTGAQQDLYANQHVAVSASGLHEAANLIARIGSLEAVVKSCEGWWIGIVEKVFREDGSEEVPMDLDLHVLKRRGLEALSKGRKRKRQKKADGGKKADECGASMGDKALQEGTEGEDEVEVGDIRGPVVKAEIRWLGGARGDDTLRCAGALSMHPLDVTDTISRIHFLYEQREPHDIKWTTGSLRRLYKPSLNKILACLPKGLTARRDPGNQQEQVRAPAEVTPGYNHAGVHVGTNEPACGEEDEERWRATSEEVVGFKWKIQSEPEDPDPPEHMVVGLRRASGKIFAVVETDQGDRQQDHTLESIRRRIFNRLVAEPSVTPLPLMMQWRKLRHSILILDTTLIAENAKYFERVAGMELDRRTELPDLAFDYYTTGKPQALTALDLDNMFLENPESRGQGRFILHDNLNLFIYLLRDKMSQQRFRQKPVLVCDLNHLPNFADSFNPHVVANDKSQEPRLANTLRIVFGLGDDHLPNQMSADEYIQHIHDRYDKMLLPCFLPGHFVVFEVALRSPRGRYIKIWDGMNSWGKRAPKDIPELQAIINTFFPGDPPDIYMWEKGDPVQPAGTCGCGPFAALVLAYLCHGLRPPAWTGDDEAVARNYLWACLLQHTILPPPKQRL